MINRSCTCSREPLMALNLHQARGEWKRKSREERQPASRYTLNLQPHNAGGSDSSSRAHVEPGDEAQPKTPRTPGPSKTQHANFIPQLSFISFQMHYISAPFSILRYLAQCQTLARTRCPSIGHIPTFEFNKPSDRNWCVFPHHLLSTREVAVQ